jgi:peptidyl-prolyl cis-trans isomerase D
VLNIIRKFSKTLFAKILIIIIIIPFIFWGMGGVFSGGNSNNIAKINNHSIPTQDFIDYINESKINPEIIKKNLENNVLEELLAMLVSKRLLEMEIKDLDIFISDKVLAKKIKNNKKFHDINKKFSIIKYEKFLITQNLTATYFEQNLKENELKKKLFNYVGGGIKSPFFYASNIFTEENKKIEIEFINLENKYEEQSSFSESDLTLFVNNNKEELKEEYINFSYFKITPNNLIGSNDFNETFFKKIDEIENDISNGMDIEELSKKLKIDPIVKVNYIFKDKNDKIYNKIYKKRNENKIQLIDENEFYVLFEINKIKKFLPSLNDLKFNNKIRKTLYTKKKYEYNKNIITSINNKKFNDISFKKISNGKTEKIVLKSIEDNSKFEIDSVKLLYSLPVNYFTLVTDKKKNVYLVKLNKINITSLFNNTNLIAEYTNRSNKKMRRYLFESFDFYIEDKYKVEINQKTLERVKNFYR